MKSKLISALVALGLVAVMLGLAVWLAMSVVGGVRGTLSGDTEVLSFEPWVQATPDVDLESDHFYDAPDDPVIDDGAPTPVPETMVAVPVIETPEDLARDEAS